MSDLQIPLSHAVKLALLVVLAGLFVRGRARLCEATLAPDSPANGQDLAELGLPRDSTVVAIIRDDHVIVPRGDTVLRGGDEVRVLTTPDAEDDLVLTLLGKRSAEA